MTVPGWVHVLPHVNAALNASAGLLLVVGFSFIKAGKVRAHASAMVSAFVASSAFLACYLVYHEALLRYTGSGSHAFTGTGFIRPVYFAILISHTVLAALVPILALRMFYLAWRRRWPSHRKLGKLAFPIWLYVSSTGVIIYWMLYHMAP